MVSFSYLVAATAAAAALGSSPPPSPQGNLSIAMIGGMASGGKDRRSVLAHRQSVHFLESIFFNHNDVIADRRMWPGVKTDNCPGVKAAQDRNPPHQRGCALAHRQAWDDFVWLHRQDQGRDQIAPNLSPSITAQPKLVIFEDDVMEIDPRAPEFAFQSILNMTTHLLFLGHCFDKEPGVKPPLCAHAYVLTYEGAKILLKPGTFDWCLRTHGNTHGNVDDQLSDIAHRWKTTGLTWAVAGRRPNQTAAPVYGFNDSWVRHKALVDGFNLGLIERWEGAEGGLFHQIKYEEKAPLPLQEGGLYQIKWPSTTVYLYRNGSFHAFPNVKTFAAMGFDFQSSQVHVVPRSQVLAAMGSTLPEI